MESPNKQPTGSSFYRIRQKLWPIHSFELKKFIPLLLIKFFIAFNYGILTSMKDTMVVTAKGAGAEVIPVLKGWVVLPAALIAAALYSKLSNLLKRQTLFYFIIAGFSIFALAYGFILFPYQEAFSPGASAEAFTHWVGETHSHWSSLYKNWIPSLFFVVAELWGSIGIGILFWGFANQISRVNEAKRSYTIFIAGSNLAAILTGPLVWFFTQKIIQDNYVLTVQSLLSIVVIFNCLIIGAFAWMQKNVLKDPRFYNPQLQGDFSRQKTKLSLLQGIKYIAKSKYLLCIATMVIAYGLTINLVEVTWKANLKLLYPNPADYQAFMGSIVSAVGIISFLTAFFFGSAIIRFLGWHFSAMLTPVMLGLSGLIFFMLFLNQDLISPYVQNLGLTPLALIVFSGAILNVLSKMMKYSFFDSTKEMAYIPLDNESKTKGKAAIDVVGSRLGKSGASWIQIALIDLVGTGSIFSIGSYLTPLIALVVVFWVFAVRSLSKQFAEKSLEDIPSDEDEQIA